MNRRNLVVVVFHKGDQESKELSLADVEQQFRPNQFSVDHVQQTYSFDTYINIDIGMESGASFGVIGVYDTTKIKHMNAKQLALDLCEVNRW